MDLMGELRLSGMRESIEYRIDESIRDNLDFNEFLCLLLEDEKLYVLLLSLKSDIFECFWFFLIL